MYLNTTNSNPSFLYKIYNKFSLPSETIPDIESPSPELIMSTFGVSVGRAILSPDWSSEQQISLQQKKN